MGVDKLMITASLAFATMLCSCGDSEKSTTVSREKYNELQEKYDMLKESVEGTLSANEEARLQLNSIMAELNTISGKTIMLQENVEGGKTGNSRQTAVQISEAIKAIKKKLDAVPTGNADKQTLALVKNLQQTIILNEQKIKDLNLVIEEKNTQISELDNQLERTNVDLQNTLSQMKRDEIRKWIELGDELIMNADNIPDSKGHGNMKPVKKAKIAILERACNAYRHAVELGGGAEAEAKVREAESKHRAAL